jgi:Na+/phosphate symporter
MRDDVVVMIVLLFAIGVLLVWRSRRAARKTLAGWIGIALILMSILLCVSVIIVSFSQASHGYGH